MNGVYLMPYGVITPKKNATRNELFEIINALNGRLERAEIEIAKLRDEANHVQKLKDEFTEKLSEEYWKPKTNERNAGRKSILTHEIISDINRMRADGLAMKRIADNLNISAGLVHKVISSNLNENDYLTADGRPAQISIDDIPTVIYSKINK
jgi:DNA-binding NarL/FixJ family response regulator